MKFVAKVFAVLGIIMIFAGADLRNQTGGDVAYMIEAAATYLAGVMMMCTGVLILSRPESRVSGKQEVKTQKTTEKWPFMG